MGVGNEGQRLGKVRVQPESRAGEVDGAAVLDLDHA
jgi:hypothetical protein